MSTAAHDPVATKAAFLDTLRSRVARQAELAERSRLGLPLEVEIPEPCASPVAPDPQPEPVHVAAAAQPPAAPVAPAAQPQRSWNIWALAQRARERGLSEESSYTLLYLRDHADARGELPACFTQLADELVA